MGLAKMTPYSNIIYVKKYWVIRIMKNSKEQYNLWILHTNDSSESQQACLCLTNVRFRWAVYRSREPDRQQYYMALCRQKVQEISDKLGRPLTCFISTFSCPDECTRFRKELLDILEAGFEKRKEPVRNRFRLYNTCTVSENANLRVWTFRVSSQSQEKKNPHMMITLGCMVTGARGCRN